MKWRRIAEDVERAVWIHKVETKLRTALAQAARGRDFDWDDWPDPAPEAYDWNPPGGLTWPEPIRPGFPQSPGVEATFDEIKRWVNISFWADAYMQYDEDFDISAELRLTAAEAWALAEHAYDSRHPRQEGDRA